MGGKRPDQYQIDPAEGRTSDHKRYPQTGHLQGKDLNTAEGDKQRLAQSSKEAQGQPFPPDVPAPSVHANRGTKIDPEQASDQELRAETRREGNAMDAEEPREREAKGTEDPRDRGVGA